jgi:hypothetical protein
MKIGDFVQANLDDFNGNGSARVYGLVTGMDSTKETVAPRFFIRPLVVFADNGFSVEGGEVIGDVRLNDLTYIDGL